MACFATTCQDSVTTTKNRVTFSFEPDTNDTYRLDVSKLDGNADKRMSFIRPPFVLDNHGRTSKTITGLSYGMNYGLTVMNRTRPITTALLCNFTTRKTFYICACSCQLFIHGIVLIVIVVMFWNLHHMTFSYHRERVTNFLSPVIT